MNQQSTAIGYVFESNGTYRYRYYFENNPENIADFIMNFMFNKITITDIQDLLVVSSLEGGFIDRCPDQRYLSEKLQPILMKKQQGELPVNMMPFKEKDGAMILQ